MAQFVAVPIERLEASVLSALLEEYASRDGTDYGVVELSLHEKVADLRLQLRDGSLVLLYDSVGEQWDLLPRERARDLLP